MVGSGDQWESGDTRGGKKGRMVGGQAVGVVVTRAVCRKIVGRLFMSVSQKTCVSRGDSNIACVTPALEREKARDKVCWGLSTKSKVE